MEAEKAEPKILSRPQKIFYGVGHIFNDLCGNCWFSYVLIYMTKVAGLSESNAGLVLLIGQLADALFTLIIGYSCDKTKITWYGKRKFWHGVGTICVLASFPFVFNLCISCDNASETTKLIYYSGFVIIFQFGWAAVQIAHLALIPEIATKASQRVELNAIRSGLTFATGIFVFALVWLLLGTTDGDEVNQSVSQQFMELAFIVTGVGFLFSFIFHVGTYEEKKTAVKGKHISESIHHDLVFWSSLSLTAPIVYSTGMESADGIRGSISYEELTEPGETSYRSIETVDSTPHHQDKGKNWKKWLKDGRLYKTGILYMFTRLSVNVFQSYFALYLTDALHFNKEAIAYFPLIVRSAGSVTSFFLKFITKKIGSQLTYVLGSSLIIGGCVWLFTVPEEHRESVYGASWLVGSGLSAILVTSLSKTAELIGDDKKSGAFVYSTMSFTDKLSTGIVIFIIQALKPEITEGQPCHDCELFSKIVQTCIPGGCAVISLLAVIFLFPSEFQCVRKVERGQSSRRTRLQPKGESPSRLCEEESTTGNADDVEDDQDANRNTGLANNAFEKDN